MSDYKAIAGKYIESADKQQKGAVKYILGLLLVVIFCWGFAETVFYKTKFESIRLNALEQKLAVLRAGDKNLTRAQHGEYDSLKVKLGKQDSTAAEMYKAVEENIPQVFRFLLRKATQKPFGVVLSALTALGLLLYLYYLRRSYLRKVATGLRMYKEDGGYNSFRDYNFDIPFWALPVYSNSRNQVSRKEVMVIGGLKKNAGIQVSMIALLLLLLVFIQVRLYYIAFITTSYLVNWILFLQTVILVFSLAVVIIWFLPEALVDDYRSENAVGPSSRRNFIIVSSSATAGLLLGAFSRALSREVARRMMKPRYVVKKKAKTNRISSDCRQVEREALDAIKNKDLEKASQVLFVRLSSLPPGEENKHYARLYDLLIYLCYRRENIYRSKYSKTIALAKNSRCYLLLKKSLAWQKKDAQRRKYKIAKRRWDHLEISKYVKVD